MTIITEKIIDAEALSLNSAANQIFTELAEQFPVCSGSDEFHFLPQVRSNNHDWMKWDDFSEDGICRITNRLSKWGQALQHFKTGDLSLNDFIDITLLQLIINIIIEQLRDVAIHRSQPSFYLTILGIGLGEAVESGQPALEARVRGIPGFLDQARHNLKRIPRLFCKPGFEMIQKFRPWLRSLNISDFSQSLAIASLDKLNDHLLNIPKSEEFLIPKELFKRIVFHHMDCRMGMDEISWQLDQEISETKKILEKCAENISPGSSWQEVIKNLKGPHLLKGSAKQKYSHAISDLAGHCITKGLITPDLVKRCPVRVEEIPDYLLPVRSNAAYSMPPIHPPKGGTFFIMKSDHTNSVPTDWRLLSAHETFPGHHLLDSLRWDSKRVVRRHIEFPLYYEGWASFSEELLFDTGFFFDAIDYMLLAKRRFWRAMRGRVDMDIHMRKCNLEEAADYLWEHGLDREKALRMVDRYILKPGYQLSYTIGRRRFRRLYEKNLNPIKFAHQVLSQGEIGFDNLEKILGSGG